MAWCLCPKQGVGAMTPNWLVTMTFGCESVQPTYMWSCTVLVSIGTEGKQHSVSPSFELPVFASA